MPQTSEIPKRSLALVSTRLRKPPNQPALHGPPALWEDSPNRRMSADLDLMVIEHIRQHRREIHLLRSKAKVFFELVFDRQGRDRIIAAPDSYNQHPHGPRKPGGQSTLQGGTSHTNRGR